MLKIENIEVTGWEAAIRGMRNPMNSWEKSDSYKYQGASGPKEWVYQGFEVGENDLDLMKRLAKGGSVHAKYRRMINVAMDITAPLYYYKELDTYKVGTVCNSCSTMHKIQAKEFTLEDFSCEHLDNDSYICARVPNLVDGCEDIPLCSLDILKLTVNALNYWRDLYNDATERLKSERYTKEDRESIKACQKKYWWQMIQLLPSSYNQRRTYQFNYEVLSHIYFDRKDHKLDCWHQFCDMIRQLPYAKEIITMEA